MRCAPEIVLRSAAGTGEVRPWPDDFDDGWDNRVTLVDGRWVDRTPRRPDGEPQLRREVGAAAVAGSAAAAAGPGAADRLRGPAARSGTPTCRATRVPGTSRRARPRHRRASSGRCTPWIRTRPCARAPATPRGPRRDAGRSATGWRADVLPLPARPCATEGRALLERMRPPADRAAVWCTATSVPSTSGSWASGSTGVIDWGDCCVGDPALDLAWTTHRGRARRSPRPWWRRTDPTTSLLARARDWHLLGPVARGALRPRGGRPRLRRERPRRRRHPPRARLSPHRRVVTCRLGAI